MWINDALRKTGKATANDFFLSFFLSARDELREKIIPCFHFPRLYSHNQLTEIGASFVRSFYLTG